MCIVCAIKGKQGYSQCEEFPQLHGGNSGVCPRFTQITHAHTHTHTHIHTHFLPISISTIRKNGESPLYHPTTVQGVFFLHHSHLVLTNKGNQQLQSGVTPKIT